MKIFIASDHAAYEERLSLMQELKKMYPQVTFEDLGTHSKESVHYPEFAKKLCEKVLHEKGSEGILLCGSGIGVSIMANKFKGIRAALCKTVEEGRLAREHNKANVLCLGGRVTPVNEMVQITKAWREAKFQEGRHAERVKMLDQFGENL